MNILSIIAYMIMGWILLNIVSTLLFVGLESLKSKKLLKSITPQIADPEKLCRGPHSWIVAKTLTKDGSGTTQICRVCGFISGSNKVASMESIDRIEESNRIREIESKLLKEFLGQEDNSIKKYFDSEIKGGLDFDKLTHIHAAGMTFNQRYSIYKASKAEEIEKQLTRSDA